MDDDDQDITANWQQYQTEILRQHSSEMLQYSSQSSSEKLVKADSKTVPQSQSRIEASFAPDLCGFSWLFVQEVVRAVSEYLCEDSNRVLLSICV